jgi:hypothetical protein
MKVKSDMSELVTKRPAIKRLFDRFVILLGFIKCTVGKHEWKFKTYNGAHGSAAGYNCVRCGVWHKSATKEEEEFYREKLAKMMISEGFSTGHGDTFNELLFELSIQLEEIRGL